ncbi:MAG TPA: substrate-binding domain-containing protein [Candidatus Anoxymicrobiaceae bacterium]
MSKRMLMIALVVLMVAAYAAVLGAGCGRGKPTTLVLGTTTSTQDSGLLEYLLPVFEKKYDVNVKTIAVGTGEALKMGESGDADVLMVHSKAAEEQFVKSGFGLERVQVMYNDFVIVGPSVDPAGIKGEKSAVQAFHGIAAAGAAGKAVFVSRGDDSGTNKAEMAIWKDAGIDPKGQPWYIQSGQGMGETLTVANEKQAYTLSDRATYVTRRGNLQLIILVEGDKTLYNQYGVIVVNPAKHKGVKLNTKDASDLVLFLTSEQGQDMIASYKKAGVVLFHPNATGQSSGMGNAREQN